MKNIDGWKYVHKRDHVGVKYEDQKGVYAVSFEKTIKVLTSTRQLKIYGRIDVSVFPEDAKLSRFGYRTRPLNLDDLKLLEKAFADRMKLENESEKDSDQKRERERQTKPQSKSQSQKHSP